MKRLSLILLLLAVCKAQVPPTNGWIGNIRHTDLQTYWTNTTVFHDYGSLLDYKPTTLTVGRTDLTNHLSFVLESKVKTARTGWGGIDWTATNITMTVSHEPVVTKTNDQWVITFK